VVTKPHSVFFLQALAQLIHHFREDAEFLRRIAFGRVLASGEIENVSADLMAGGARPRRGSQLRRAGFHDVGGRC
jgi:hypothetical protein